MVSGLFRCGRPYELGEATFGMSSGFDRPPIWVVWVLVISLLVSSPQTGLSAQIPKPELLG